MDLDKEPKPQAKMATKRIAEEARRQQEAPAGEAPPDEDEQDNPLLGEDEIARVQGALEAGEEPWLVPGRKRGMGRAKKEKPPVMPPVALDNYAQRSSGEA
eukprot:1979209-Amphidinium_carterae.1